MEYSKILDDMRSAGVEVNHGQQPSEIAILELEKLVSAKLPDTYRNLVSQFGFAGSAHSPYKGIAENNPELEAAESAFFQTTLLRTKWGLPDQLLVVHLDDQDELATCINLAKEGYGQIMIIENIPGHGLDISIDGPDFKDVFIRDMNNLIEAQLEWERER